MRRLNLILFREGHALIGPLVSCFYFSIFSIATRYDICQYRCHHASLLSRGRVQKVVVVIVVVVIVLSECVRYDMSNNLYLRS